ncbi:MAG: helix-turn-helix transcriptional regulator [Candidatus Aminicenantes bacterium]|nr:helix-turn-helix transcriptional regulator [Candidatus Aminicenantes bacterium]
MNGPTAIGKLIKDYRERRNLTQNDLGRRLGYKYGNFIGMIETGASQFPLGKCIEYADALGIDRTVFIETAMKDLYPELIPYIKFVSPDQKPKK